MPRKQTGVERAVEIVGSQSEMGRLVGVRSQAVNYWVRKGHVPAEHCQTVHRLTNYAVPLSELNPAVYRVQAA